MTPAGPPSTPSLLVLPYHQPFINTLVDIIVNREQQRLPDLSDVTLVLPGLENAALIREAMLRRSRALGIQALLTPVMVTLKQWVESRGAHTTSRLNPYARQLELVDVLRPHMGLFGVDNPWLLSQSLSALFDELTLQQIDINDRAAFHNQLKQSYGSQKDLPPLDKEASIVYQLWHAWRNQLEHNNQADDCSVYLDKLQTAGPRDNQEHIYLTGFQLFNNAECEFIGSMMQAGHLTLCLQGQPVDEDAAWLHPDQPMSQFLKRIDAAKQEAHGEAHPVTELLNSVFTASPRLSMHERAARFVKRYDSNPLDQKLFIHRPGNAEMEAHAVELQIRRWWLDKRGPLGIVTEDRRLARRIRALLERAGIHLQDSAGWALSTTSAATVIERWLQCVESAFDHMPLLDLLKSPFFHYEHASVDSAQLVYRLEQDIILHENIASGIDRYKTAIQTRLKRLNLPWFGETTAGAMMQLLEHLESAARPLLPLANNATRPVGEFMKALETSLRQLQLTEQLTGDEAGEQVVSVLHDAAAAADDHGIEFDWFEFRAWLGHLLEHHYFTPAHGDSHVYLLSLNQSVGFDFDGLIIAGAEKSLLPSIPNPSPFFNNHVRQQLGLTTQWQRNELAFYQLRRLLQSADSVLITARQEQDGEPIALSPWLECLQTFIQLAYQTDLVDNELETMVTQSEYWLADRSRPAPHPGNAPCIKVPAKLIPRKISASAYQQLVDCPYQFFAARALKLAPPDEIRMALQKSDFGERIHRCLQAFYSGVKDIKAFSEKVTIHNRDKAVAYLEQISHDVFKEDIEDNFQHRGWLQRWLQMIPLYIDWQINRDPQWHTDRTELNIVREQFDPHFKIQGRLDRVDRNEKNQFAVLDYKTGQLPTRKAIDNGEAVQLPFYYLLLDHVIQVEYVGLEKTKITHWPYTDEHVADLAQENAVRLRNTMAQLHKGQCATAWGDKTTCSRCHFEGLCRKSSWTTSASDEV